MNQGTFSDYHDRWTGERIFTGVCCFGAFDHWPNGTHSGNVYIRSNCGIFYHELFNMSDSHVDDRLGSRLSEVLCFSTLTTR